MKKLTHDQRRRQRKQRSKRSITLTLEPLEPRLVLSAAGFGFEGPRGQWDSHDRHHGNHEANRPAFAEHFHDKPGERIELANRSKSNFAKPVHDGHPRGDRPNEPFGANSLEVGGHGARFNDRSELPPVNFAGEGEATARTREFEERSSSESVNDRYEPNLYETIIPSTTATFVSLTPASSFTHDNATLSLAQPTARLTPPRTVSPDSPSPQSGSAATRPVTLPVSSSAPNQTLPNTTNIELPRLRFEPTASDSDTESVPPARKFDRVIEPAIGTFVSVTSSERWWNGDGESVEADFKRSDPLTESAWPSAAIKQAVASLTASVDRGHDRLSEATLWADVREGGLIDIDAEATDSTRERFEFEEDAEEMTGSKRLSTRTPKDAFWFDFGDPRLDLICDSLAVEELAEEQALDDADDTEGEAWLVDDGGMIVLTSSQFIDQADEVAFLETGESSITAGRASAEIEIPLDAGIGVFQAIEVSAAPVEQQVPFQAADDMQVPMERKAAADADPAIPAAEQAAKHSDGGTSGTRRAASMSLLFAITALFSRGRERRLYASRRGAFSVATSDASGERFNEGRSSTHAAR